MKSTLRIASVAALASLSMAGAAAADSMTGTINAEWIIATPVFGTLSLPAVQSIDSVEIEIAHTNGNDLAIFVLASDAPADFDFDLMFQETAGASTNFSMGVAVENGALANVAPYTFVPVGGGGYTAPHTPSTVLNANAWTNGPLAAQEFALFVNDLSITFDGGAIGSWTINYTPVPEPGAWTLLALAALTVKRRRT